MPPSAASRTTARGAPPSRTRRSAARGRVQIAIHGTRGSSVPAGRDEITGGGMTSGGGSRSGGGEASSPPGGGLISLIGLSREGTPLRRRIPDVVRQRSGPRYSRLGPATRVSRGGGLGRAVRDENYLRCLL